MKKILLMFILLYSPICISAITLEEYNNAVVEVARNTINNYSSEFAYSFYWCGSPSNPRKCNDETNKWFNNDKLGIKSSGNIYGTSKADAGTHGSFSNRFSVYCDTFVKMMVHHASNGKVAYEADYEKINTSDIKKGDLIHFDGHIAIYLDDGGTGKKTTYRILEASGGTIRINTTSRESDHAFRLKSSALSKLDYNTLMSSYDFHDRLDDYPPIINSLTKVEGKNEINLIATDNKHYDLSPPNDEIEPENNGIEYYAVTKDNSVPTTNWTKINRVATMNLNIELKENGTYYVWVKDVGGNVTSKSISVSNLHFDTEGPKLGNIETIIDNHSIKLNILNASDESGIKEYHYYLNGEEVFESIESSYVYENLVSGQNYSIAYEIVDKLGNISKSENFNIQVDVNISSFKLEVDKIVLCVGDTYQIKPIVETKYDNNYTVSYDVSDSSIIKLFDNGNMIGLKEGKALVKVSIENLSFDLSVNVYTEHLEILNNDLNVGKVNKYYEGVIETNYPNFKILVVGNLPEGLYLDGNKIVGVPTREGEYKFTLKASYDELSTQRDYTIIIEKNYETIIIIGLIILIIIIILIMFLNYKKKKA